MPELIFIVLGLALAGAFVLLPLRKGGEEPVIDDAGRIRHRASLEALRDVEADRRAGSLDDGAYAAALAEAEAHAAETRAALDGPQAAEAPTIDARGRRWAAVAAVVTGLAIVGGSLVPATGLANGVVDTRQERIAELTDALVADPTNTEVMLALADAYLEGTTATDLSTAVRILQVLLQAEPEHAGAYERVVAAYIRGGDWANARAAVDDYATIPSADPVEVAFLDGLVAIRGEGDADAAIDAFDRFLTLAPDDPRADMIRSLRDQAKKDGGG
jgi:predicted Zn-dependent protease